MIVGGGEAASHLARYPGFSCFKTRQAIRYKRRWYRDALIRMALNPEVIEMWPDEIDDLAEDVFSFMVRRADGAVRVTVSPSRGGPRKPGPQIELVRGQMSTPEFQAGRDIWRRKNIQVTPAVRLTSIAWVRRSGDNATIGGLLEQFKSVDAGLDQVLALIASGYLMIDLRLGLDLESRLLIGPMAPKIGADRESLDDRDLHPLASDLELRRPPPCPEQT
jgi:hypothetical protein